MDLSVVKVGSKQLGDLVLRNSPTILTGLGVGGLITTVVMAIVGTNKARDILFLEADKRTRSWSKDTGEHESSYPIDPMFSKKEVIKLTWQCYLPATLMGASTIACIIGSNSINLRRNAALAGLYSLAEVTLKEYQDKVIETIGEKKEAKMKDEMSQDRLNKNPVNDKQIIITGRGDTLCYDSYSGRYFKSDIDLIKRVQNEFNQRMIMHDGYRQLNEFYDEIGLESIDGGKDVGWTTEYGLLEVKFGAKIATDNTPCIVLDYRVGPMLLP